MPSGWDLLQQVFTVQTIMTPWHEVTTIDLDELGFDSNAVQEAQRRNYTALPIVAEGRVMGVFDCKRNQEHELTTEWLISRDTPIPGLIAVLANGERPLLCVMYAQDIVGIVTPADINKMPIRIYLYNLLAELETKLVAVIYAHYDGDDEAVLRVIDKSDQVRNLEQMSPSIRSADVDVGLLQMLYLSDLVNILKKTPDLHEKVGFASANQVKNTLNGLVHLRNDVMHSVRPLLLSSYELARLHDQIVRAREVLGWLDQYADRRGDVTLPLGD